MKEKRILGLKLSIINSYAFGAIFTRLWLSVFLIVQLIYSASLIHFKQSSINTQMHYVTQRVALDLSFINENLPMSAQQASQPMYLTLLNEALRQSDFEVEVLAIGTREDLNQSPTNKRYWLSTVDGNIAIEYQQVPVFWWQHLSIVPLLFSAIFSLLVTYHILFNRQQTRIEAPVEPEPLSLTIDLQNKQLINYRTNKRINLANKPLCFYSALVEYCLANPGVNLNQNKPLPDELEGLCKKYFARLIELGHTIRKRPNFTNNLEKTLSEIRAVLDELFEDDFENKDPLYPKKAVGEGSRSRAHSYALSEVDETMILWNGN